jgi:hypothetical protein
MKTIEDCVREIEINESNEDQVNESFLEFARVGIELTLLASIIALYAKSLKDIVNGENGMIEIANKLREDVKISRICKKLAKDEEIKKFLSSKDNVKKADWEQLVASKLNEKESQYLLAMTKEEVEGYVKK